MVRVVSRLSTGGYGALDGLLEAPPLAVAKERLQVTGAPVLCAVLIGLLEILKGSAADGSQLLLAHNHLPNTLLGTDIMSPLTLIS